MDYSNDADELEQELLLALEAETSANEDGSPSAEHQLEGNEQSIQKRKRITDTSKSTKHSEHSHKSLSKGPCCDSNKISSPPTLASLSEPCLLRVLARLSPEDLCTVAQTSKYFRIAASDPGIWRALYYARWRHGPSEQDCDPLTEGKQRISGWKSMYMQRDGVEVAAEARRAPDEHFREIFKQMATAKRSEPLAAAAASMVTPVLGTALAERVAAFRRTHGLGNASDLATGSAATSAAATAGHSAVPGSSNADAAVASSCPGGCSFVELEPHYWICERGGHVHLCGDNCTAIHTSADASNEMLVCSITGRCFPRLMSEWEEAGGRGGGAGDEDGGARDGEDPGGGDWNATEGMGGRLGRAFFAGYNAVDEEEMLMKFGVKL